MLLFSQEPNQFYSSWFTSISKSSFFLQPHSTARLHSMRTSGAIPTPIYFSLSHTHTYFSQDISVLPDSYSSREEKTLWIKIPIYRERLCPCVSKVLSARIQEETFHWIRGALLPSSGCYWKESGLTKPTSLWLADTQQFIHTPLQGFVASFAKVWPEIQKQIWQRHTD